MIRHYYKNIKIAGTNKIVKVKFSADLGEIFYMGDEKISMNLMILTKKIGNEVEEEDYAWRQIHKND